MGGGADGGELAIPARLAATVVRWEGERGAAWLDHLPRLVAEVAEAWGLDVGAPFEPGGNISWVAPAVRRADGRAVVLKVQHPHPESAPEAVALAAWAGNGAVQLLAHDADRAALLLERCRPGRPLTTQGGTIAAARTGADLGARLHTVAPPAGLPTLAQVLDRWADELESRLRVVPWPDPAFGRLALVTMRDRPRSCTHGVLLHGDLNPTNVLSADREPWLAIDAKPMVGDPAYDGPRLVLQPDPLDLPHPAGAVAVRVDVVAEAMGVHQDALVAWCLADAVQMGASARTHGDDVTAARCVAHATLLAPLLP